MAWLGLLWPDAFHTFDIPANWQSCSHLHPLPFTVQSGCRKWQRCMATFNLVSTWAHVSPPFCRFLSNLVINGVVLVFPLPVSRRACRAPHDPPPIKRIKMACTALAPFAIPLLTSYIGHKPFSEPFLHVVRGLTILQLQTTLEFRCFT